MSETDPVDAGTASGAIEPLIPAGERLVHEEAVSLDGSTEPVVPIVEALATVRNIAVADLVPTIHEAIDPDGLERIFRPHPNAPKRTGWVTFFFSECRVVLLSDGRLQIYDQRGDAGR